MRFLRKNNSKKTIIVISDVHLGAGEYVDGVRNYLEDFHYDEELVDFLEYFSKEEYANKDVELIINGDFFDLLAVPYIKVYDDEFWSEESSLKKLKMILEAHKEVMQGLNDFLKAKNKKITFIIGNHDAELVFKSLQDLVLECFEESVRSRFEIRHLNDDYRPADRVVLKHGHEYEIAHTFDEEHCIIEDESGKRYFNPPWGSYYVTRVINKFKEERDHVNAVRPINKFLINGLIYDTFFTLRFMLANVIYFIMVRSIFLFKISDNFGDWLKLFFKELTLFQDYESLTFDYLQQAEDTDVLIVGHTHEPICRTYSNGKTFINTGTWTRMYNLDFGKGTGTTQLTFAKIEVMDSKNDEDIKIQANLHTWMGRNTLPYGTFN
ncbi:calcineurin-like phosphoesterase family protein [Bacteriovorax sp. BAL6_X]|uniref:metallophosphoesterase n=1 Tax=Bacteriovorax sp. BAL6_X TaxID=1201290 RepID=UPI000386546E|nr:metallophosphoesterase [Bacteriovorax sp. BAL6_X]EPZ51161.1 calcineurin-like phosphoesterase family protein [Bacteriovorax sp. BAL6_X]